MSKGIGMGGGKGRGGKEVKASGLLSEKQVVVAAGLIEHSPSRGRRRFWRESMCTMAESAHATRTSWHASSDPVSDGQEEGGEEGGRQGDIRQMGADGMGWGRTYHSREAMDCGRPSCIHAEHDV